MSTRENKTFLVIADNAGDALLIRRAFKSLESCDAVIARNVSEAKAYLDGAGMYQEREKFPLPNAVICNFQLGVESGIEFLKWIKGSEFKAMPVFVLVGVASTAGTKFAKDAGAVEVLAKPARSEDLAAMFKDFASKLCS